MQLMLESVYESTLFSALYEFSLMAAIYFFRLKLVILPFKFYPIIFCHLKILLVPSITSYLNLTTLLFSTYIVGGVGEGPHFIGCLGCHGTHHEKIENDVGLQVLLELTKTVRGQQ